MLDMDNIVVRFVVQKTFERSNVDIVDRLHCQANINDVRRLNSLKNF